MGAFQKLKDVFAAWGRNLREAPDLPSGKRLYLYLPLEGETVPVGVLSQEGKEFIFSYDQAFQRRDDLPAISAFPSKSEKYHSPLLWPFFEVRLPPLDRPDVAEEMKAKNIDPMDVLALLATFGRKTLTTPYEFELERMVSSDTTRKAVSA